MSLFDDFTRELRYAARAFRREPAFVAGVILTFGIAIGANAAMFGLVQRLMLAPPPGIRDADRVVTVGMTYATDDGGAFTMTSTSYPVYQALSSLGGAFSGVAAMQPDSMTLGRGSDLSVVAAVQATGQYFSTLGVQPAAGRLFGPADDELPSGNDVVVVSYAFWQRRFGGDRNAIGQQILVDDQALMIIGVTPRGFNGSELGTTDVFVPLTTALRKQGSGWWSNAGIRMVTIVARLRDGVASATASPLVTRTIRETFPEGFGSRLSGAQLESVVPGRSARQSAQGQIALWLSGVSVVVLLIATANVGTLLLLRAARRRRDVAVRTALGATRWDLARQMLVESMTLALAGCLLGVLLSRWFADLVRVTLLPNVAGVTGFVDPQVLAVSVAVACVAGLLAGLGPLASLGKRDLSIELRAGGSHGASGRFVFQRVLLGVQVSLSVVLIIGAGLFVQSLRRVQSQDLGFSTARLLHVQLDFQGAAPALERDRVHADLATRVAGVAGVAGVTGATVVQGMPFSSHNIPPINIPGYDMPSPGVQQIPIMYAATPLYLEMMGVTLRSGRLFTSRDTAGSPLVVLVNETLARTAWPGQNPIGRCIKAGHAGSPELGDPMAAVAFLPCREVVGVVRDSRARSLRADGDEARLMQYYVPLGQTPPAPFPDVPNAHGLLVRTAGEPDRYVAAVQRIIQSTSPIPVYARVRPYQSLIDPQLRSWRLGATLFSVFGFLALAIAAIGLFAVVSYLVTQRTREIGVRLALGGSSGGVVGLVIRDAVRLAAIGGALGVIVALAGGSVVQAMLYRTSARDPAIAAGAVFVLLAVTIGAAAIPAWRAGRVSPMTVLREDQ